LSGPSDGITRTCRDCHSPDLVPRGSSFRNRCHGCWNKIQRDRWATNRETCRAASKANYRKHSTKRRAEASAAKTANREYYTLAEWFRRKGIPIAHVPTDDLTALIEMKRALKTSKILTKTS